MHVVAWRRDHHLQSLDTRAVSTMRTGEMNLGYIRQAPARYPVEACQCALLGVWLRLLETVCFFGF